MTRWADDLGDPVRLRRAIQRLLLRGREGLPRTLLMEPDRFARLLARDVRERVHVLAPATVRRAQLDKERELYVLPPADLVLHGAFAEILTERMEPRLSSRLYSYRRGRSSWSALADLVAYLRAHRRARPDPRTRGLHVLHGDVRAYGESIPVADDAPVWSDLREVLGDADEPAWELARGMVRPAISGEDQPRRVGLPTGSPVATAIANLYLAPLDRELERVDGAFSARYGDDILFAHPSLATARAAQATVDRVLAARGLELNAEKQRHVYLTGSGRAGDEGVRGAQAVVFLGMEVTFAGTVALPARKERELLGALRERARRAARLCAAEPLEARGAAVAAALGAALDPRSVFAAPHADLAATAVTDRARLGHLDGLVALAVAEAVTGRRGVRAFRAAPPSRQRRIWGVPSLVVQRNRGRRRR